MLNPVIVFEGIVKGVEGIKINGTGFADFTAQIALDKDAVIWIGKTITGESSHEIFFE